MRAALFAIILLIIMLGGISLVAYSVNRGCRSFIAQLSAQADHHLAQASKAYDNNKPGLAAEHEDIARSLKERISRLEAGDDSARIG